MIMMTETAANFSMKPIRISGMVLRPPYFNMDWSLSDIDVDINWIGAYQKKKNKLIFIDNMRHELSH